MHNTRADQDCYSDKFLYIQQYNINNLVDASTNEVYWLSGQLKTNKRTSVSTINDE
jgi:hypothetical protein